MKNCLRLLPVLLCIAAVCLVTSASADIASFTLEPGDNWIAASLVPYNPNPSSVFAGIDINHNLTRWDSYTQTAITYDASNPLAFGRILLGEGYIYHNSGSTVLSVNYEGVPSGVPDSNNKKTDMWISLTTAGMNWIGNPFAESAPLSSMMMTDGNATYTMAQAMQIGWIDSHWTGFNADTQHEVTVGLSGMNPKVMEAYKMYKFNTYYDNLALIVPAQDTGNPPPSPEPSSVAALLCGIAGIGFLRRRR